MKHECGIKQRLSPPTIKIEFTEEDFARIANGPLAATGGRGAATWARRILLREVERAERIAAGRTQIDFEELEARR